MYILEIRQFIMTFDHTILLAHGSRDSNWLQPFIALTERLSQSATQVSLAFMELAEPTLEQAVINARNQGAQSIAVLPLFFAAGKHLREDVPAMIAELTEKAGVDISLLPPLGEHPLFIDTVEGIVRDLLQSGAR
ncbi:uncharacterized conserved protein [Hahella chejuensis KCTC 2396]|uniref:Uncharacterized conserved protein n=2 Tax=Hahella chejuensis TaxID=158327 RepID=Q2SD12_HAHCH|nr:uncharacterized conserved protein [Hahella chejuensis KCTC 2396]